MDMRLFQKRFYKSSILLVLACFLLLAAGMDAGAELIGIAPTFPQVTVSSATVDYSYNSKTSRQWVEVNPGNLQRKRVFTGEFDITGGYYANVKIPGENYLTLDYTYNMNAKLYIDNSSYVPYINSGTLTVQASIDPGSPFYSDYVAYLQSYYPGRTPTGTLVASDEFVEFGWGGANRSGQFEFIFNNNLSSDWFGVEFDAYAYVLAPVFNVSLLPTQDWDTTSGRQQIFKTEWVATSNVTTWVPIPAGILLLGSGILGIIGIKQRRNRRFFKHLA